MMKTQYKIKLKSDNGVRVAEMILHPAHKQTFFEGVIHKTGRLFSMAKSHQVYACLGLKEIHQTVKNTHSYFQHEIHKYGQRIQRKNISFKQVRFSLLKTIQYDYANPLVFSIIRLLELYDQLSCLIVFAKDASIFQHQNAFMRVSNFHKKRLFQTLSFINQISLSSIPKLTIQQYIDNGDYYQTLSSAYGEVIPEDLFVSISQLITPYFLAEDYNKIAAALKARVALNEHQTNAKTELSDSTTKTTQKKAVKKKTQKVQKSQKIQKTHHKQKIKTKNPKKAVNDREKNNGIK